MTLPLPDALNLDRLSADTILNSLADGAYITDVDRRILFWNLAAERITGWTRDDVVGRSCRDNILVHVDKDGHCLCGFEYCPLRRAMVTGQRSTAPMLVFAKTKTGERLPVEVMVSPIRDSRDQVVGGIEIFRDLSEAMNDLRRARAIQLHTMETPAAQDPRVAIHVRYIPHELVGGDFYRVERIDEDRYAVMIADVSGHGLASALYTMQLRSLWEEYRPVLGDPAALLSALNSRLYLFANRDDQFATALHAVIDASRREFRWACAGHLPPLLVSKHPAASRFLPLRGQALGMMTHASYAWDACRLKPDDAILLYTDGAIEILNARQQELGDEGLRRLAAPVDLHRGAAALEALEESLLSYSNEVRLQDDLTLLSIQCPAAGDG